MWKDIAWALFATQCVNNQCYVESHCLENNRDPKLISTYYFYLGAIKSLKLVKIGHPNF